MSQIGRVREWLNENPADLQLSAKDLAEKVGVGQHVVRHLRYKEPQYRRPKKRGRPPKRSRRKKERVAASQQKGEAYHFKLKVPEEGIAFDIQDGDTIVGTLVVGKEGIAFDKENQPDKVVRWRGLQALSEVGLLE